MDQVIGQLVLLLTKHCLVLKFQTSTVNFLNIRTPKKIIVITLKFEQCDSTME